MTRTLALILLLVGCGHSEPRSRQKLYEQVSFDYDCPREKISIVMMTNDRNPRAIVDVCGVRRKFRDIGGNQYVFNEVKETVPTCGSTSASVK